MKIPISPNELHIWSECLSVSPKQERSLRALLSEDECERADRFRFATHKQRFITARATLRKILGTYLGVNPKEISFAYTEYNKPYLLTPKTSLTFNVSHSNNIAVYVISSEASVGIDIEKTQSTYNPDLAKRFFSVEENAALSELTAEEQITEFYRLWSRKEALVKASGKGLTMPLNSFSVVMKDTTSIKFEEKDWYLAPITLQAGYQITVASNQAIKRISCWKIVDQQPALDTNYDL
ncbi:MAG: 4'-phosphopantetheinyl transferase family protein [Gammaproteobacteria bacterium]